jgi:outer membrane protein OmpA-like peptidoglycan-associated protein
MFASVLKMVDKSTGGDIAHMLGQPEQTVSGGLETSIAALLGGLASKSNDPSLLGRILDIAGSTGGPVSWSQILRGYPDSPLLAAGKRLLPTLFGTNENAVVSGISRSSGLPAGVVPTLLSMAGPFVMSFISKWARDGQMSMSALGDLLQRESPGIRNALPAGVSDLFWPARETVPPASPVVAQAVQRETSSRWVLPVLLGAIALGGLGWLFSHLNQPRIEQARSLSRTAPVGEANRIAEPTVVRACSLPATIILPAGSVESRLLASLQNPGNRGADTAWITFDQMLFDTGSTRLRPQAEATLKNTAAILANCPNVSLTIAGFTDNVGNPDSNLRLSRNRANTVVGELVRLGVPRDHLSTEGYGQNNPVADNGTSEGRAENRRVAMRAAIR